MKKYCMVKELKNEFMENYSDLHKNAGICFRKDF